jgi:hypothetical protein
MALGCSGSGKVLEPAIEQPVAQADNSHQLWGMWQFVADPAAQSLDIYELRTSEMHINALPFLEPPPLIYLSLETLQFNGNIIETDIGLRHPFLGLNEFTGMDVCGVLITRGSVSGYDDSSIVMAGEGDTRLLNADGYTRWWNPVEFPVNEGTMFSYNDGLLGAPHSAADYNATVNGYKLFCDDLVDPDASVDTVDVTSRCIFSAGQKNIRHYSIEIGNDGLVFNYAIDANWQFPQGDPPYSVPDDFGPEANRAEAWNFTVTMPENTLWNDGEENGGDLSLSVEVWDHFNADMNTVKVESPGNFDAVSTSVAVGGGEGYSTYEVDIVDATPGPEEIELFITIEAADGADNPYVYFFDSAAVDDEPYGPPECGTGNHGTPINTPFTDVGTVTRFDAAWLVNGPYAGEMIVSDFNVSVNELRRYDMDTISPKSGSLFAILPPIYCPPAPPPYSFPPFLTHIEVEPVTGRVIVVPFGPEANNRLMVFDNAGNLLNSGTDVSVGPGRRISAMGTNENGDIWLVSSFQLSYDRADDCRLQRYAYQSAAPYYVHDPSSDLELDEVIGSYYNDTYGYVVINDMVDLVVLYPEQRIFLWHSASFAQHNGRLTLFDINSSGPPTHLPLLSSDNLLSIGTWNSHTDYFTVESAAMTVDHADSTLDGCRVSVMSLCRTSTAQRPLLLARVDRDGNVLNEVNFGTGINPDTMGINHDPDPSKANLVFIDYSPSNGYMSTSPSDW